MAEEEFQIGKAREEEMKTGKEWEWPRVLASGEEMARRALNVHRSVRHGGYLTTVDGFTPTRLSPWCFLSAVAGLTARKLNVKE